MNIYKIYIHDYYATGSNRPYCLPTAAAVFCSKTDFIW